MSDVKIEELDEGYAHDYSIKVGDQEMLLTENQANRLAIYLMEYLGLMGD